jgi:hypothetical protein
MWLGQESAGGRTNVEKCTSVPQRVVVGYWMRRVQGFKAEKMSAPVGPRDSRKDVVGPRECRWSDQAEKCTCVHERRESENVLLFNEESAGAQSGAKDCTCRSQRLWTICGRIKRVQVVGPKWRGAPVCTRE